jgi:hypothetical protein
MSQSAEPEKTVPHEEQGYASDELEPGAPQTPAWLTLLGGGLLLAGLLALALVLTSEAPSGTEAADAGAQEALGQPVPAAVAPEPPAPQLPAQPVREVALPQAPAPHVHAGCGH